MNAEMFLFIIATVGVPAAAVTIFFYLQSSFALVELLQRRHPDLWHALGEPTKIRIQQQRGGFYTITPLRPWLSWIWSGETTSLPPKVTEGLVQTRRLLRLGLIVFGIDLVAILALISVAPS
jgi:hypothetical protein